MRGQTFKPPGITRAVGYAAVAVAIAATALHVRHMGAGASASLPTPSTESDPLAAVLARCQAIGTAAQNDAGCEAAWAENRRRFFTDRPAESAESAPATGQKPAAKPEGP
jgi:conjugative transfer region protein TrbK